MIAKIINLLYQKSASLTESYLQNHSQIHSNQWYDPPSVLHREHTGAIDGHSQAFRMITSSRSCSKTASETSKKNASISVTETIRVVQAFTTLLHLIYIFKLSTCAMLKEKVTEN